MDGGIHVGPWPIANRSDEAHDAIERLALYEARLATEIHGVDRAPVIALIGRVRRAFARPTQTVDACAACAA